MTGVERLDQIRFTLNFKHVTLNGPLKRLEPLATAAGLERLEPS